MSSARAIFELKTNLYIYRYHIVAGILGVATIVNLPGGVRLYHNYVDPSIRERDLMVKKNMIKILHF